MYWAVPRPFTAVTTHNIERWWLKAEKKKKGEKHSWIFEPNSFQISKSDTFCIKFRLHCDCPLAPWSGRGLNKSKIAWEIWLCMIFCF